MIILVLLPKEECKYHLNTITRSTGLINLWIYNVKTCIIFFLLPAYSKHYSELFWTHAWMLQVLHRLVPSVHSVKTFYVTLSKFLSLDIYPFWDADLFGFMFLGKSWWDCKDDEWKWTTKICDWWFEGMCNYTFCSLIIIGNSRYGFIMIYSCTYVCSTSLVNRFMWLCSLLKEIGNCIFGWFHSLLKIFVLSYL